MVMCERCGSNQVSRESLVGRGGGGGTAKSLSSGSREGQLVRDQSMPLACLVPHI